MLSKSTSNMLASALLVLSATPAATALVLSPRAPTTTKKLIVQMFEWTYDSVALECGYFLGTAGVGFVQVSPAQENWNGNGVWWDSYQPESYNIAGKHGNRASFANMVTTCHNNGVGVIVDTVMNHQTAQTSGTGFAGDSFTKYVYPGTYQYQDFHHTQCGSSNGQINNYNNATEVQDCELDGLADLATETEYVRARLAQYINDLISLGVDGLRLDASKHMPVADIANILSRTTKKLYITQEVIYGAGEPITPNQYTGNGDVQEFRFTTTVQSAFSSGNIAQLQTVPFSGWVATSSANAFVANHDTERNGGSLNYLSPNNEYVLSYIYALSFPYGTPTVLSSYSFSNTDVGAPNGGAGTCYGTGGVNGWLCQHRWIAIAGMIGFYNQVGSSAVVNWVSDASNHIAYGRGALGHVGINLSGSAWTRSFTTSLPAGTYCDIVHGSISGTTCSGPTIVVANGAFTTTANAYDGFGIHTGAKIK
ncbi:hypothetical protein FRB94_002804 [Tulasnella sp. JGI-2019a]|nr:hypothetical protein FRB93_004976 [Tulasnella sp. JGI-2019a]KAG9003887.1 hypothetical protein FRB94_002804 [Tulasnella sp. JGI-2019a]KAG9031878.1 hypothetical protein FRB95_002151 [Tulasnella sp. JGI-2019a]